MKHGFKLNFLLCGILLTFAAFPVFAQNETGEDIQINKKPMADFGNLVKEKIEKGEIDLTKPFKVVVEGVLTRDGKFDTSLDKETKKPKSQITLAEGDEKMVEVAKMALEAVGDSGWLGYLRNFGAEKVKMTFAQDNENTFLIIESEQATPEKARLMASGLGMVISTAKYVKLGEDETILINGAQKPTVNGKIFIFNFALPKQIVQDMIKRNLKKAADAEKPASE